MFFNNISSRLINLLQSCHRGSGGQRWGGGSWAENMKDFRGNLLDRLKDRKMSEVRCPPVTWSDFPLLSPLITVSDGKWWKSGGWWGWWRDEGIWGRKGWESWHDWGCVWNAMNLQNEPRAVSPIFKLFHTKSCWIASSGKSIQIHMGYVGFTCIILTNINSDYRADCRVVSTTDAILWKIITERHR